METINTIVTVIQTVGFPIVCCGAMAYYIAKKQDKMEERINDMSERHNKEMLEVTQALNNNTMVIEKLCVKMDRE